MVKSAFQPSPDLTSFTANCIYMTALSQTRRKLQSKVWTKYTKNTLHRQLVPSGILLNEFIELAAGHPLLPLEAVGVDVHGGGTAGMAQVPGNIDDVHLQVIQQRGTGMPLRYNNDKRKKPLFSRGSRVCRHLFNSFSKLKSDEKNIKKRRLFH